ECFISLEVRLYGFETLADGGVGSGFDESNCPIIDVAVQKLDLLSALRPDKIVEYGFVVLQKEVLNQVAFVSEPKNEFFVAEVGEILHRVPQNRTRPVVYVGFRDVVGIPPNPHPGTAAKENHFHDSLRSFASNRRLLRGWARRSVHPTLG